MCTKNPVLNAISKDFVYTNINHYKIYFEQEKNTYDLKGRHSLYT